jgi:hypothetical protein
MDLLPADIRVAAGQLILSGYQHGTLVDKKWAVEVAGIAPPEVLLSLLRDALRSRSRWLRDTGYEQAAKLLDMPHDIAMSIRASLIDLCSGRNALSMDKLATQAHLSRLSNSAQFLSALRLLLAIPYVEVTLQVACLILVFRIIHPGTWRAALVLAVASLGWTSFFIAFPARVSRPSVRDRAPDVDDQEFDRFYLATALFLFRLGLFLLAFGTWTAIERGRISLNVIDPVRFFRNMPTKLDLLLIYAAAWAPFSDFAVLLGKFVHPVWWAAIPSSPLVFVASRLRRFLQRLLEGVRRGWKTILWFIAGYAAVGLIALYFARILDELVKKYTWLKTLPTVLIFSLLGFLLLFLMTALLLFARDAVVFSTWRRRGVVPVHCADFLRLLSSYGTNRYRLQVLRMIRQRGLLNLRNKETVAVLTRLLARIQDHKLGAAKMGVLKYIFFRGREESATAIEFTGFDESYSIVDDWYSGNYVGRPKYALASWSVDTTDEIYKLLEQAKSQS